MGTQAEGTMDSQDVAVRPNVHIVSGPDSIEVAKDILHELGRLGVNASAPAPTDQGQVRAVVVLLTAAGVEDPSWLQRVEALRTERLVPVCVGELSDDDVPEFLRELNWVFYRPNDPSFVAQLFAGINTDASRFRDTRDTRSLAERWDSEDRNPDFLLDDLSEVKRRIETAASTADGSDPLIPPEQVVQLAGTFRDRFRFFFETIMETEEDDDDVPTWLATLTAARFAATRGRFDDLFIDGATIPVAFLAASRKHAARLLRQRLWRATYRTTIAVVAVVTLIVTVQSVQQALKKDRNSISFAFGRTEISNRPDLAAFKAGASLVDSGTYSGSDGRLRITVDAMSQHWPLGYIKQDDWGTTTARILSDGSISSFTQGGKQWTWTESLGSTTEIDTGAVSMTGGDISLDGSMTLVSNGTDVVIVRDGASKHVIQGLSNVRRLRLAPADQQALIQSGNELYVVDGLNSDLGTPTSLGTWDAIYDLAQTTDGHAVALAETDGSLQLVYSNGTIIPSGRTPGKITLGSISPDGISFALSAEGMIWTSTASQPAVSSGLGINGVVMAMAITDDGLVLVSDRTQASWVADPTLGLNLGRICNGMPDTREFVIDVHGDRVLCLQGSLMSLDSLAAMRPSAVGQPAPSPVQTVIADSQVKSLSIHDGLIRVDRATGSSIAYDAAGISLASGYVRPKWVDDVEFFATGALIGASSLPTTVAVTPDGNTFAIGFVDGRVIEVDINENGGMARVGSWQLPDHAAVGAISWSTDAMVISATTEPGTTWDRPSCSGCWNSKALTERIAQRAWLCYAHDDLDSLGDTAIKAFRLRDCESLWGGKP